VPPDSFAPVSDPGHPEGCVLHASAVAWEGRALLIAGPSGSGKSALALTLMAWGCDLVADDRTALAPGDGHLVARCPTLLFGTIEARGIGLLHAAARASAPVALAIDMGRSETARLPPERGVTILGIRVPLLHKVETGHFAPALLQYLKSGRK